MIALVLATLSGLSYGAADFSGAVASKRTNPVIVTLSMQGVSLVALNAFMVVLPDYDRRLSDLAWAGLGGLALAVALTCFYSALATGPMTTAAATTALVGTVVPVGVGLALGDAIGTVTLLGVLCCIPAGVMVSAGAPDLSPVCMAVPRERLTSRRSARRTLRLSLVAGAGFGAFFVMLSRVSADAGLFPLVGARAASIAVLAAVLSGTRSWERVRPGSWPMVVVAGVLDCVANSCYLLAVGRGQLTWVAAVSSLYPVSTVILARIVLKERLGHVQIVGLALSVVALVAVAASR